MSDPHPEARTLAEALEPVAWLLTNEATGKTMVTQIDPGSSIFDNERIEPLYLASHPPAEPGWVESWIVEDEDGPRTGFCIDFPDGRQVWSGMASLSLFAAFDDDTLDTFGASDRHVIVDAMDRGNPRIVARAVSLEDAVSLVRAIARCRFAERASGEEGGA